MICAYLVLLAMVNVGIFVGLGDGFPAYTESQSQLLAALTSVLPVVLIFSFPDCTGGSIGKRRVGLKLYCAGPRGLGSLVRNVVKFTPWQIAHLGSVHGACTDDIVVVVALSLTAVLLLVVMTLMGLFRADKRHLGDLLARTQVQCVQD